jgi:hypothetical protein
VEGVEWQVVNCGDVQGAWFSRVATFFHGFSPVFHGFFTRFSGASAVILAGYKKTLCFFIFLTN